MIRAEPVRDLRSEGPPPNSHMEASMLTDKMHVVHPCAAGLDVHKMEITATVRLCSPEGGDPETETEAFSTLESGMRDLVAWLRGHGVTAAAMEATGLGASALEDAGIHVDLLHAQHVKQIKGRKTDVADSMWLACQFGLAAPSLVLPREFRRLRVLSRHRRRMIDDCARLRNRVHKILDRDGIGGVLSDVFGVNGMRILRGMVDEEPREEIVASRHVADKRDTLEEALAYNLAPYSRQILGDLLDCHDYASQKIACYDKLIREGLDGFEKQLLLLQTIPGQGIGLRYPDRSRHWRIRFRLAPPGPACAPATTKAPASGAADEAVRATRRCARCWCAHGAARTDNCQFQGYHKALRVRCGARHRRHCAQAASRGLLRPSDRQALPGPRDRLRSDDGEAQRSSVDPHARNVQRRGTTKARVKPQRAARRQRRARALQAA